MTLRTVEEYKNGIKDSRKVFIMGKPVDDVTVDPYIKVGVETAAHDFMMGHDEKMRNYLRPATLFNATKFSQYSGELL